MHHRHPRDLLDPGRQVHERLGRQRHRRHAVDERVVGVGAGADHAQVVDQAGFGHRLRDLAGVLVGDAVLVELVAAHPQTDAEITTHRLAHRLEHTNAEAQPVLEAAAPFVGAVVDARAPELVDQVLVRGRDLDAVEARLLDASGGAAEVAHDAFDLFALDDLGVATVHRLADARGRHEVRPVEAVPGVAAAHVGRLDHDLGAVLVHRRGQARERLDDPVGRQVDRRPPRPRAVLRDRARSAADRQADSALGLFLVVADVALARQPAFGVHLGVGGADDAIADRQLVQPDRFEEMRVAHGS